jgi:glycosyltransferase involved in cell wall biosynthesis
MSRLAGSSDDTSPIFLGMCGGRVHDITRLQPAREGAMLRRPKILEAISEGVGGGAKHVYDLVCQLQGEFAFSVACPNNGPYFGKFKELDVPVFKVSFTAFSPRSFFQLRRRMQRDGIELVHVHGRKAGFYGRLACLFAGTPVVYSFHGLHYQKHGALLRTLSVGVERALSKRTDRFINVSNSERQACLALGLLNRDRSLVVNNGIDWQSFDGLTVDVRQVKVDLGFDPNDVVVGHIAKFDVQKAQDDLAAAIPFVLAKYPTAKFLFVGDGTMRPQIEDQVARLGVDRQVVFTGYRDDVASLLKAIDVVALPSRWEGLSLVLLEAMACRKPIVASRVTGNVDVVVDGVTGLLVPSGAPRALADKIVLLLQDAQLCDELGRHGRERVEQEFSLARMVAHIRSVYQDLLDQP